MIHDATQNLGCLPQDPPMRMVLHCVQSAVTGNPLRLESRSGDDFDWADAMRLAARHRLFPLVYHALNTANCPVPPQTKQQLTQRYYRLTQHSFGLMAETLRLLNLLSAVGIRVLPLKGPLLALQAYGDPAVRTSHDIDLLIDSTYYGQTKGLLQELGYRYRWQECENWSQQQEQLYLQQRGAIGWYHTGRSISLDLHVCWFQSHQFLPLTFDRIWQASESLAIQGQGVFPVLSTEHQILYLCVHGAKHYWNRLLWLADILALSNTNPSLDWQVLYEQAAQLYTLRPVAQALLLLHEMFGQEIPLPWRTLCRSPLVKELAAIATTAIVTPEPDAGHLSKATISLVEAWQSWTYRAKLQPRLSYKVSCASHLLFSAKDWKRFPLPTFLWPLYIVLRPIFYGYRLWQDFWRIRHSR
jgi:Uncharacterised nucleotidyltransferase